MDRETQGLAFDRVAIFTEVRPGVLPDDHELGHLIVDQHVLNGGGGNDYRLSQMARFYTERRAHQIELNIVERRILSELLAAGLLRSTITGYQAPRQGALISVWAGGTLSDIDHEFNHAVYFVDPDYQGAAVKLWKEL